MRLYIANTGLAVHVHYPVFSPPDHTVTTWLVLK